ncbi:PQQ-binding-like beta-propeller repeat protein [Chryseolinea sp. T2]|uniref:outer membrane protein assembly factor BamB family protein n=1 Tax=Chryseolinea sp. T2 TaxID=3129255 RepID=UPI0030785EEC
MQLRISIKQLASTVSISKPAILLFPGILAATVFFSCGSRDGKSTDWSEYLGGPDRNHYSSLTQIDSSNVKDLTVAWEYHAGDSGQVQCNPIIVNNILYAVTASVEPFALDAATGKELWRVRDTSGTTWYGTSRGLTYWEDGDDKRILYTKESWLYAVDALTGKPVPTFGEKGRVSLGTGLGPLGSKRFVISNTPGTVYEDLIIMPIRVSESTDALPGNIQAFNIRTGELAWKFKTIPHPGEVGYETWPPQAYQDTTVGGANSWSGMAVDRSRGMVYVPTGSAAFDFYGANRTGDNLFANTLLALNARTGERIWHYQFVHHDVLDRDAPAPPNLVTVMHGGKKVDAVAQVTKHGYVFLFNREDGTPLFPIEEIAAPASDIPGEVTSKTQPRPTAPAPYARQSLTADDINPNAPNHDELVAALAKSRNEGPFTPLSRRGTIIYPGLDGGAEWGGVAVDPDGIMYLNSSEMAWLISLDTINFENFKHPGERFYMTNCSSCHGRERKGNPASGFPSLIDPASRFTRDHVSQVISTGKGMMPAFRKFSDEEKKLLVAFLFNDKVETRLDKKEPGKTEKKAKAWRISGYTKFLDSNGHPPMRTPWGTLNAIDLNTGNYLWKVPFGETPELNNPQTGSDSYGGPVITASGLLFIAGTKDSKFRVYNMKSGKLLWETRLPVPAFATPSTYSVNGRQYVVMACGGTKLGSPKGDSYVAFTLPQK